MLCTWWVYICGSNVSGGEQASLSTKADFACCSPRPAPRAPFACTPDLHGPPTCPTVLTPGNCTGTNSSTTKESRPWAANPFPLASWPQWSGPTNKHSAWHLLYLDNTDPVVSVTCHSEQIYPMHLSPSPSSPLNQSGKKKKKERLVIYHSVLCCSQLHPLCSPSLWHNGELFLWYDLPGPGLGWGDWGDAHSQGPASALPLPWLCDLHSVKLYQLLFLSVVVIWGQVLHQMFLCCFSICCQKPLYA